MQYLLNLFAWYLNITYFCNMKYELMSIIDFR